MKKLYSLPHYSPLPGVFKGLLWSMCGTFLSIWIISVIYFSGSMIMEGFLDIKNISSINLNSLGGLLLNVVGGLFYALSITIALTLLTFIVLGLPVMLLPATGASIALSVWLHRDAKQNRLSARNAQIRGAILGGLAGVIGLFIPIHFFLWPELWIFGLTDKKLFLFSWAILIVIPSIAAITGSLFGKSLARELEPKDDFFEIDWNAIKNDAA